MEIDLPEIPAGVVALLGLITPYAVAVVNGLANLTGAAKRVLSVVVALALAGVALGFYYWYTGDALPELPALLLLAVVVAQASYALLTKNTAKAVEDKVAVGALTRAAKRDPHQEDHSVIPAENADGPTLADVGGWVEEPLEADAADDDEEPDIDLEAPDGDEGDDSRGRYAE